MVGRLKQLVAEQALDIAGFKAVLSKSGRRHRRGERPCGCFARRRSARNGMPVDNWKWCERWCVAGAVRAVLPRPTSDCACV